MFAQLKTLAAGVIGAVVLVGSPALAQKVAYYDHGKVVRTSKAWKSVESQLQTKRDEIAKQLEPVAAEMATEGKAIEKLIEGKTEDQIKKQYGERIGQYQAKAAQLQRTSNRVSQEFNIVLELTESKINSTLVDGIFEGVAKKRKVDVLARKSALGFYGEKYDATDDVLSALDRKLATLSVDELIKEVQARQQAAAAAAQ